MSSLKDNLKSLQKYAQTIDDVKNKAVFVGLPKEKATKTYEDGMSVIRIGAIHEYGIGNNTERSFLRVPFAENKKEIDAFIQKRFEMSGKEISPIKALEQIGVFAEGISKRSFVKNNWKANAPITIDGGWMRSASGKLFKVKGKGSSKPLIDTGVLRNSITSTVR